VLNDSDQIMKVQLAYRRPPPKFRKNRASDTPIKGDDISKIPNFRRVNTHQCADQSEFCQGKAERDSYGPLISMRNFSPISANYLWSPYV